MSDPGPGPVLVSVEGIGLDHRRGRGRVAAVDGVTFELRPGERLSIIGPSGAGKSTLARLIVALLRPDRGRVVFEGRDLASLSDRQLRRRRADIQLLFQDSWGALDPRLSARTSIEAPLSIHGRPATGAAERLADLVQLHPRLLDVRPPQLSGGERQRVTLARALALEPKLLVLDEPLTGLDPPVADALRQRILRLQADLRVALIWITHDLDEVEAVGGTVAVMDAGRFVEVGPVSAVVARPQHGVTRALVGARRGGVSPLQDPG